MREEFRASCQVPIDTHMAEERRLYQPLLPRPSASPSKGKETAPPMPNLQESSERPSTCELDDVWVVCRFEPALMNKLSPAIAPSPGPPAQWTYGIVDFNHNWTRILWIGEQLDLAKEVLLKAATKWRDENDFTVQAIGDCEYRLYLLPEMLQHQYLRKLYSERPFREEEKWTQVGTGSDGV
jgi:hypothetical protein